MFKAYICVKCERDMSFKNKNSLKTIFVFKVYFCGNNIFNFSITFKNQETKNSCLIYTNIFSYFYTLIIIFNYA